jgi:hypothetical protein
MPQQQSPQQSNQWADTAIRELVLGLVRSICLTIEVFFRRDFGSRYVGSGFVGVVVMWFFSLFFPPTEINPLFYFSLVYCAVWLVALIRMLIRYFRGKDALHSKYTGRPHLWRLLPGWREDYVKHLDAVIAILLGFGVRHFNVPLGDYLMAAASLLLFRDFAMTSEQRNRAVDMNDQVIEQKLIAEKFRAMQER